MILLDTVVPFTSQHFVLSSVLNRDQWRVTHERYCSFLKTEICSFHCMVLAAQNSDKIP